MESNLAVTPSQLSAVVKACLTSRTPLLVKGAPGVGKTDIIIEAANDLGFAQVLSHPAIEEPSDSKGIPWPDANGQKANYLVAGALADVLAASTPTAWFIDDLGQAAPSVQAPYMQWVHARQCGGHKLPDCVSIVAATNRRSDKAGVSGVLEPVKSRFIIVELHVSNEDWSRWAIAHNQPPELIAYLRNVKCDALHKFDPSTDIVNSPCPRTWAAVGRVMQMGLADASVLLAMFAGCVGEAAATEFTAYLKLVSEAPSVDEILAKPTTTPVPGSVDVLYAVASSLAHRATKDNFAAVSIYLQRMHKEGYGEFCAFAIRDTLIRDRTISTAPAWHALAKTEIGRDLFAVINSVK